MAHFDHQIAESLGWDLPPLVRPTVEGHGTLPSYFDVSDLALSSLTAAAAELASLRGAKQVCVHRRHALQWFDMTLRPLGWQLPSLWDDIAGDYQTRDGWIRLHTNAPHHRAAALRALGCASTRDAVAACVKGWTASELEQAVVAQGGCAAEMRDLGQWAKHPQGQAVGAEPLIHWRDLGHSERADTPFSSIRILDLTRVLAGPVATRFLAGFGAQVLRIDPPNWNEPPVEADVTLGKRCAGLDLTLERDKAQFRALLAEADVLVHGYRPGALDGLGFDLAMRRALNPALIDISLNAYGWTGPWSQRRGFDSLVQMSTGIASEGMRRARAARPVPLPVQALDHATGYLMAAALLRALRIRAATGRVMQARLSLARTAHMLIQAGPHDLTPDLPAETPSDLSSDVEQTDWGPAHRITCPVTLDGAPARWPFAAGRVRRHPPAWSR